MSFDAGQFFNNLFNNIGNISDTKISRESKTDGYNFHEETKMLPDETSDEQVKTTKNMLMYAVPDKFKEEGVKKYAVPNPEPSPAPTENKEMYALPNPDPNPAPTENKEMYALPKPTSETPVAKYAMPDLPKPTAETPVTKYAMPVEPTPEPTSTQQPDNPTGQNNPWNFSFQKLFSNIFGSQGTSFAQRLNNIFSNIFSWWK